MNGFFRQFHGAKRNRRVRVLNQAAISALPQQGEEIICTRSLLHVSKRILFEIMTNLKQLVRVTIREITGTTVGYEAKPVSQTVPIPHFRLCIADTSRTRRGQTQYRDHPRR